MIWELLVMLIIIGALFSLMGAILTVTSDGYDLTPDSDPYLHESHSQQKINRWIEETQVREPGQGHGDHDVVWTSAPGIWNCRDCVEWYRTWEDEPEIDERQW